MWNQIITLRTTTKHSTSTERTNIYMQPISSQFLIVSVTTVSLVAIINGVI